MSHLRCKNRNLPPIPRLLVQVLMHAAVALSLSLVSSPLPAQDSNEFEYRAKANYLANFPSFVEWPEETSPSNKAPFLICVFGEFSFGTSLSKITRGTVVRDRRVEVRWIRKHEELSSCQILFVSRSEQKKYRESLDAVRGRTVFTVGETPEFLGAGGILSFSSQEGTIRFDVNLEAANKVHLKISSRLLALARHVMNQTAAARN